MPQVLDRRQLLRRGGMAGGGAALLAGWPGWAQSVSEGVGTIATLPTVSGEDIRLRIAHQMMTIDGRTGHAQAAFRFRRGDDNPLPFEAVKARGHRERLVGVESDGEIEAMSVCTTCDDLKAEDYRSFFAHHCAEHIVRLLNDERVGFRDEQDGGFRRLMPADIAILVRDRREAAAVRQALVRRKV
ncbi:hypothetical protein LTR94_030292, partial [Friedmanniomyces endolithicus]